MASGMLGNKTARDAVLILAGLVVAWVLLQAGFGVANPFYVVSSGSMVPELQVYDIIIVSGKDPFGSVQVGDIIVFDRPSDHDRVIVHRVAAVIGDDPYTLRTKGDANSASISGTDYPITSEEYIGTVVYVVPQIGYVSEVLKPPVNYIIIAIIIAIMIAKHYTKKDKGGAPKDGQDLGGSEQPGDGPLQDAPEDGGSALGPEDGDPKDRAPG